MKHIRYLVLIFLCFGICSNGFAQSEAEVNIDNILFPRITTVERDAIAAQKGMVIFNSTTNELEYHDGTVWGSLGTGSLDIIEDPTDADTYVRAFEFGDADYIAIKVEGSSGTARFKNGPNGDIRLELANGSNANINIGEFAGDDMTGINNIAIGRSAGGSTTTGSDNIFIGKSAGFLNVEGIQNTFIGRRSGYRNLSSDNTFLGYRAGTDSDDSEKSVFVGSLAGESSEADFNVAIGYEAGKVCQADAISNTMVGFTSGKANTTGSQNSFFGQSSGESNTTGINNTFLGSRAGESNTDDNNNTFIGYRAGSNTNGLSSGSNTFIGAEAGRESDGTDNVYIGAGAGQNNTSGIRNVYIGEGTGGFSNIGNDNVYIGYEVGRTAVESDRLRIGNTENDILLFGEFDNKQLGVNNTSPQATLQVDGVTGDDPLRVRTGTSTQFMVHDDGTISVGTSGKPDGKFEIVHNSTSGSAHLELAESGSNDYARIKMRNTGTDYWDIAGATGTTDQFNLFFYDGTTGNNFLSIDPVLNNIAIDGDVVPGSTLYDLGNNSTTEHWDDCVADDFINFSDRRLKEDIEEYNSVLNSVLKLRPVTYKYIESHNMDGRQRSGFIAQEVQEVFPNVIVSDDIDVDAMTHEITKQKADYLSMNYIELIPILTKAIQEQQQIIEQMQKEIELLKD